VAELGRRINPFKFNLLQGLSRCVDEHALTESHDTLLDTWNGTLHDDKVVLDLTITDETTHSGTKEVSLLELYGMILSHGS